AGDRIRRVVDHVAALRLGAPGRPLLLVGHGAGGDVAHRAATDLDAEAVHVVALGAPHGGAESPAPRTTCANVVNLYSLHDAWIVPPERAYLAGAFNVALRDVGHFRLVVGRRAYTLLQEHL